MVKSLSAAMLTALALSGPLGSKAHEVNNQPAGASLTVVVPGSGGVATVRPTTAMVTKQQVQLYRGISTATAGSRQLSMNRVVLAPGAKGLRHRHRGSETVIFILEGEARTLIGPNGDVVVDNKAGDFLFIPADVWHQPTNVTNAPVIAIEARADADDQSNVILAPNQN